MSAFLPSATVVYVSNTLMCLAVVTLLWTARKHAARLLRSVTEGVSYSGRDEGSAHSLLMAAACASLGAVSVVLFIGFPWWGAALVGLATAGVVPRIVARKQRAKFQEAFDGSLTESLTTVSSSLRAGLTLRDSLSVTAQNSPPVFSKETTAALKQYRFGVPIEEALDGIRRRVDTPSANIAFGAMIIASQLGGNLPDTLKRIVGTIRERERVEGRLKTLTAQGRSQAFILCAAPIVIGVGMYFYDPSKMALLTETFTGQVLLTLAIVLEIIGIIVTRRVMMLEI